MSREERKLRKHIEAHAKRELLKANKHLSKMRANEWKPPREKPDPRRIADDEEILPPPVKKKIHTQPDATVLTGFVAETGAGFCDILCAGVRLRCRSNAEVAIGDQVLFSAVRRRVDRRAQRRGDIDAGMDFGIAEDRIHARAEAGADPCAVNEKRC